MTEWDDIVMADWSQVAQVVRQPKFLFDGRNALNPHELQEYGFQYKGIGRGQAMRRGASAQSALSAAGVQWHDIDSYTLRSE